MPIKLVWEVKHNTAGRYIFCEGKKENSECVFLIFGFIAWEKRIDCATAVIEKMSNEATEALLHWAHHNL